MLTRKTCGSPICCTQRWLHRAFAEALVRLIERHVKKKKKALGVVIKNKRKEEERGRTGSGGGDCVATPYGDDDDDADEEEEALEERENEEVLFLVLQLLRTLCHVRSLHRACPLCCFVYRDMSVVWSARWMLTEMQVGRDASTG